MLENEYIFTKKLNDPGRKLPSFTIIIILVKRIPFKFSPVYFK